MEAVLPHPCIPLEMGFCPGTNAEFFLEKKKKIKRGTRGKASMSLLTQCKARRLAGLSATVCRGPGGALARGQTAQGKAFPPVPSTGSDLLGSQVPAAGKHKLHNPARRDEMCYPTGACCLLKPNPELSQTV